MIFQRFAIIAVLLLMATSLTLLLSQRWRWSLIALAVQYVGVFWLVGLVWPITLTAVKLVIGWMVVALLGASQSHQELTDDRLPGISGYIFRALTAALILIVVFSVEPLLSEWLPVNDSVLLGGLVLIGMGLLHLGMTVHPARVILGLLTTLAGFEIIYAALEPSVLVAGLLAFINLGLGIVGIYLLSGYQPREVEQ